jgi:hypothetical protein
LPLTLLSFHALDSFCWRPPGTHLYLIYLDFTFAAMKRTNTMENHGVSQ